MSRTVVLVSSTLVCASVACTVNGRAIGPRFGAATAATPSAVAPAAAAAPAASSRASDDDDDNKMLVVPNLLGMSLADANQAVRAAGFAGDPAQGAVSPSLGAHLDDKDCLPGIVCGQDPPAGRKSGRRTGPAIEIGDADQAMVVVPNLVGMTEDDADLAVLRAGFKQGPGSNTFPRLCAPGRVCAQRPAAGERVKRYTIISLDLGAP